MKLVEECVSNQTNLMYGQMYNAKIRYDCQRVIRVLSGDCTWSMTGPAAQVAPDFREALLPQVELHVETEN